LRRACLLPFCSGLPRRRLACLLSGGLTRLLSGAWLLRRLSGLLACRDILTGAKLLLAIGLSGLLSAVLLLRRDI
jgi:hypothetical protein